MTNSPSHPVTQSANQPPPNPYVGPRTFSTEQRHLFFGREREARDLLARVLSERLLLFYAQSGAGKSSLLHARLIPLLQEEKGFVVLPVGRVSGELPAGVAQVDNIFVFNLLLSVDEGSDPGQLAQVSLGDFLARLARRTVVDADGQERKGWVYDPDLAPAPAGAAGAAPGARRYALIVDQFEEIITSHPARWREREDFFRQVDAALAADPNVWVVLTLREDYVAALDPYAELCFNRLRARFYMERMDGAAALEAIRRPAELGGRPFAPGVAEQLVDNLRQVRVAGREDTVAGQYVEPVQLQVVCYQLWENLARETAVPEETPGTEPSRESIQSNQSDHPTPQITFADLAAAGNVDQALTAFYEETLAAALADPAAAGVSERQVRAWFDEQLITGAGTRGLVHQGERESGGLPNGVVRALQRRFLVRGEARGGDVWIELVHDRFVEPIRASNAAWFPQHLSALQRQAGLWIEQGRSSGLLLRDEALAEAKAWAEADLDGLESYEKDFLAACCAAEAAVERERRQNRRILTLGIVAASVALLAIAAFVTAWSSYRLAREQINRQAGLALLQEAYLLRDQGDGLGAIEKLREAERSSTDLGINVAVQIQEVRRSVATRLTHEGEALARDGDLPAAELKFQAALALDPPPDTPIYVWIEPGSFSMGSLASEDEQPLHEVWTDGYWIQRTEITNGQYLRCVQASACDPPHNTYWDKQQYLNIPVTHIDWFQANGYAEWIGGRLPTEAEWEKACRGLENRSFSWGDQSPSPAWANITESGYPLPSVVGSYPAGAHGLYDMSGNVWEWTSTLNWPYPYVAEDGRENQSSSGDRVIRGGAFNHDGPTDFGVSCTVRGRGGPSGLGGYYGFRTVIASPGE